MKSAIHLVLFILCTYCLLAKDKEPSVAVNPKAVRHAVGNNCICIGIGAETGTNNNAVCLGDGAVAAHDSEFVLATGKGDFLRLDMTLKDREAMLGRLKEILRSVGVGIPNELPAKLSWKIGTNTVEMCRFSYHGGVLNALKKTEWFDMKTIRSHPLFPKRETVEYGDQFTYLSNLVATVQYQSRSFETILDSEPFKTELRLEWLRPSRLLA